MNKTQMQGYRLNYKRNIVFPKSSILVLGPRKNSSLHQFDAETALYLPMIELSAWSLCLINLMKRNSSFGQQTRKFELNYTPSFSIEEHVISDFRITSCFPLHVQQHTCTLRSSIFFFWSLRVDSLSMYIHFFVKFVVEANLYLLLWFHFWNTVSSQSTH